MLDRILDDYKNQTQDMPEEPYGLFRSAFHVGGVCVGVSGNSARDVGLAPPLEGFRVDGNNPDICVRVERISRLEPRHEQKAFDSGATWELYGNDDGLIFDFHAESFRGHPYRRLLTNRQFSYATLQMNAHSSSRIPLPVDPLEYPLDELLIMHRLTQERGIELHGTGIVRANGVGNLFVGHSGAGKSTTTRLWTSLEDVEVLSDDRIIVRGEAGVETPLRARGAADKHEVLRLRDCSASRSNHSAQDDRFRRRSFAQDDNLCGMRMYGTPWHGEAMFASPNSAPLSRIFILEHGCGNVITRLSRSQAVAELFARAFVPFHRHEYIENALSFLEQLVDSVPCYRYLFEPDERAVKKIQQFND
jgi:hypothetical protein